MNGVLQVRKRLSGRESVHGGRSDALWAIMEPGDNEEIRHYDIVSMYPSQMVSLMESCSSNHMTSQMELEFPVGHPEVLLTDFGDVRKWREVPYKGLIRCNIRPPDNIIHPVLAVKSRDALIFGLCQYCIDNCCANCSHTEDKDRALHGTWTHLELNHALQRGYTIVDVIEVSKLIEYPVTFLIFLRYGHGKTGEKASTIRKTLSYYWSK